MTDASGSTGSKGSKVVAEGPPQSLPDHLIRATAAEGKIRVVGLVSTQAVQEARERHKLSYVATVALGRAMSAGLLLAANLKRRQARINLQLKGDGPLGNIWVDAGLDGTVRGYVGNPAIELPLTSESKLDVGQAIGRYGYLHVLRDLGYGQPYTSAVELVSGEVGDDVTYYLSSSEQTPSAVLLGVNLDSHRVRAAGGVLLQVMPGAPASLIPEMETRLAKVEEFSPMLASGGGLRELLQICLGDLDLKIVPEMRTIRFYCKCNSDRVKGALRMLGRDELMDMIHTDKGAEAVCHFCNEVYRVSEDELRSIVADMSATV
ncbi:MAG: Hsp33 family molecular chaperone HslO [Cyanobacteriota bacterium]